MAINLNRQPYFDDFDKNKNFVRVLFKPSRPVQVRELNQLQAIQKNQLELFANHIFKEGSKIEGRPPAKIKANYITVNLPSNNDLYTSIKQKLVVGATIVGDSGIEAIVIHITEDIPEISPLTLYINYTKTATNGTDGLFSDNEIIYILDNGLKNSNLTLTVRQTEEQTSDSAFLSYPSKGKGILWQIEESVYYSRGYFLDIQPALIVGEAYEIGYESYTIGFDVEEEIIDIDHPVYGNDLYDNSLGYPNFAAPGADRLKIKLTLAKRSFDTIQNENFVVLVKVEEGVTTYIKSRSDYATIMETLAERTYDESGNYTVKPITIKFRDHQKKDEYDSYGMFYPKDPNNPFDIDGARVFGDENKFVAIISPIKAYIKGFLVETIAESRVALDKSRDLGQIDEFYDRVDTLNYFLAELADYSAITPNSPGDKSIFNNTYVNLKSGTFNKQNGAFTGATIGKVKIRDIELDHTYTDTSVPSGTNQFRRVIKVYFSDIELNAGQTVENIAGLHSTTSDVAGRFFSAKLYEPLSIYNNDKKTLIYELAKQNVFSLKDIDTNKLGIDFTVRRCFTTTPTNKTPINGGNYQYEITFNTASGEFFDDYNPNSSFAYILKSNGEKFRDLTFSNADFNANTDSSTLTLYVSGAATYIDGSTVFLIQNCIKRNSLPKLKYLTNKTEKFTLLKNTAFDGIIIFPNYTDLIQLYSITVTYNDGTAHTDEISLDSVSIFNGQTDLAYYPISLTCSDELQSFIASKLVDNNVEITVNFDYYARSGSGEYFSIDSYRNIIDDQTIIYGYEDVPTYYDLNNKEYKLTNCLDFRPDIFSTSRQPNLTMPALNSIFNTDLTYYLSRIDYIVINKDGKIYQKKGLSSETPRPPTLADDDSEMAIMMLRMKPYIYDVKTDVVKNAIENKRYTMRDIGRLEKRIENLEYYTSFTLLEMQTETASVKDAEGFDRYKNGFIAENFKDFLIADIQSTEFKAAHDPGKQDLRPAAFPFSTNLEFDPENSANWIRIEDKIIIDFDEQKFVEQPFASKSISLNPYFIFERKGVMELFPNCDNWTDVTMLPELSVNIDTGTDNLIPAEPIVETYWDSWRTISEVNVTSKVVTEHDDPHGIWLGWGWHDGWQAARWETTVQTDINVKSQQRTGTEVTTTYETRIDQQDLGERVTDVDLMTYAREFPTVFGAGGLKPNTRVYAFYDDVAVSEFCAPYRLNANLGDPLQTDKKGNVAGIFIIPPNKFFTGQKTFRLTNERGNEKDQDTLTTSAEAKFWSGGLSLEKQATTLNVKTFDVFVEEETLTQNRVTVDVKTTTTDSEKEPYDPLAQTFMNDVSCFITAIEVFFDTVGYNDRIWVQLKNVVNGYPGPLVIGETIIPGEMVETSEDASVPTRIAFPFPLYIEGGKEYAVVVGAFTPESRIFCSLLGKYDLTDPSKLIDTQPSMGTLFKGQNNATWTASQYEDMKLNIYRALFKYDTLSVVMQNVDSNEYIESFNPFETQAGSNQIRVYARNHGMSPQDKILFNILEYISITLVVNTGVTAITGTYHEDYYPAELINNLNVGQDIFAYESTSALKNDTSEVLYTGKATINKITIDEIVVNGGTVLSAKCELKNVVGRFNLNNAIKAKMYTRALDRRYNDKLLIIQGTPPDDDEVEIDDHFVRSLVQQPFILAPVLIESKDGIEYENGTPTDMNGIDLSEFASLKTVKAVDSIDTFIIETAVNNTASDTGRCGETCKFPINRKYELFNVSGAYTAIDCEEEWTFYGVGHENNGLFSNENNVRLYGKPFPLYSNVFLKQPYKFSTPVNENGQKSNIIIANFKTNSEYMSPVIDVSTFSTIMVSNRVDFIDPEEIDILPNAIGRFKHETDPNHGSEVFKYVTKNIVLKNPAMDLKIYVDVYKPIYTDFDIYLKVQPTWDYTSIDTKEWIKLDPMWKDFTSKDLTDYREVSIITNELMPDMFGAGSTMGEFSSFKIKIVGRARNSANPPLFRRLRAIALT